MSSKRFKIAVYLPSQAAADTEATITKWNVAEGESFNKGKVLAEIESAKTSFDFEAPCNGTIVKLRVLEGETVSFDAPERRGSRVVVDVTAVRQALEPLLKREDLARYIL